MIKGEIKAMKNHLREEELFLILISFWATVLATRAAIFIFFRQFSVIPGFIVNGIHIHHYVIGIALVLICGAIYFIPRNTIKRSFFHLLFLGIGCGLFFDEASLWVNNNANYWAADNFISISFFGAILFAFYYISKKQDKFILNPKRKIHKNPKSPYVSVVIPAYNEEKFMSRTFESLLSQDDSDFELIVVDNNSTDNTVKLAKKYGAKVIVEKKQGVIFSRQAGFLKAKGEIVATTDADTVLPENWISTIKKNFKKNSKLALFGGLCNFYSGPITAKFSAYYLLYPYRIFDKIFSGGWKMAGANMAIRKKFFDKIGGFDTSLKSYEDIEISQRLKDAGETAIDPCLAVETSGRRFRHGFLYGVRPLAVNEVIRVFSSEQKFVGQSDVRTEKSLWSKIFALIPVFSLFACLFFLFYFSEPSISQVKQVKAVKEKAQDIVINIEKKQKDIRYYLGQIRITSIEKIIEGKRYFNVQK